MEKISGVSYQGSTALTAAPAAASAPEPAAKPEAPAPETTAAVREAPRNPQDEDEAAQQEKTAAQNAQVKKAVEDLSRQMKNSVAVFGIHEKTNRVTIKIVDKSTEKVIKEFPPEETLDMIAKVWEVAGILVDEKR